MKRKDLIVVITLLNAPALAAQVDQTIADRLTPPMAVRAFYDSNPNPIVSDDFNGSEVNFNQWSYRNGNKSLDWGTDASSVYIEAEGDVSWVSMKGIRQTVSVGGETEQGLGSGLVSNVPTQYGFYILKWRMKGQEYESGGGAGWHPSVWGSRCNFAYSPQGDCVQGLSDRIELDFMEGFESNSTPYFTNHVLLWGPSSNNPDKNLLKNKTFIWPTDNWKTIGLEYTPEYIRLWELNDGDWEIENTNYFTSNPTVEDVSINDNFRTPVYWIMSNKVTTNPNVSVGADSWLQIDLFYHYAYAENIYAENQIILDEAYSIKNASSEGYLKGNEAENSFVLQSDNSNDCSEWWQIVEANEGIYKIKNLSSGNYLKVNELAENGGNITSVANADDSALEWRIMSTPEGGGKYYLQSLKNDFFLNGGDLGAVFSNTINYVNSAPKIWWEIIPVADNLEQCVGLILSNEIYQSFSKAYINNNGLLTIQTEDQLLQAVQLFDLNGKQINSWSQIQKNHFVTPLNRLRPGMYLVGVQSSGGKLQRHKILIR